MTPPVHRKVETAAVVAAFKDGETDLNALAERFHVHPRTIRRNLVAAGVLEKDRAPGYTSGELTRALHLAEEGMPANWIAEDVGGNVVHLRHRVKDVPNHAESVREWTQAWAKIRRNPALRALHEEFSPAHRPTSTRSKPAMAA